MEPPEGLTLHNEASYSSKEARAARPAIKATGAAYTRDHRKAWI